MVKVDFPEVKVVQEHHDYLVAFAEEQMRSIEAYYRVLSRELTHRLVCVEARLDKLEEQE